MSKNVVIFISALILLMSCQRVNAPNPYATPTVTPTLPPITIEPLPTAQPRPDFINNVSPVESSIMSVDVYRAFLDMGSINWDVRSDEIGHNSSICINLNSGPFLEKNDDFTDWDTVLDRISIFVDSQQLTERNYAVNRNTAICTEDYEGGCNWLGAKHTQNAIGFNWVINCWPAELSAGLHEVLFEFRQTSGIVQSYGWQFALINESIPLATIAPHPLFREEQRDDVPLCNEPHGNNGFFYTTGISVADVLEACGKPDIIFIVGLDFRLIHMVFLEEGIEVEIFDSVSFGFSSNTWKVLYFQPMSEESYWQDRENTFGTEVIRKLTWEEAFGN